MRLFTGIVFFTSESWYSFFKEAVQGVGDLGRAYWDIMISSHQDSNRYLYARGNYDAAQRGPGGVWAAKLIRISWAQGFESSLATQEAEVGDFLNPGG
uniref:Serum amyloid A protein n=1 Tax=Nomascus leucogenys TaxID=61853 RepID=A0A2I3HN72_NOMLE